ncbi:unnamed protein product [Dovyalis caffra]|uniref:Uncharacterized protein n=1 Tax=Dovyalis caffra TaxID=77055 RepID=A0AAV1SGD8_9ROSI|nr:unnamed protein product [Dovyalis caffra]
MPINLHSLYLTTLDDITSIAMYCFASSLTSKAGVIGNSAKQIDSILAWSRSYMAKDIKFGVEAYALMLSGMEELVDVVKVTVGLKDVIVKNIGVSFVNQVANAIDDMVGNAGMNAMDLRHGILMAIEAVVTTLKSRAKMIKHIRGNSPELG